MTHEQIRLAPLSFTIQVNEAGDPNKPIAKAESCQGATLLNVTNDSGPA